MPNVGRVGDYAGGAILDGANSVTVNDLPVARIGSNIADHGIFSHDAANMAMGTPDVTAEDLPICVTGHTATCGHQLISNSDVEAD